jgi:mono/diheme cytochrome c family protein
MNFYRWKNVFVIMGVLSFLFVKADEGKELFTKLCSPCHTINKGRLVGPDLAKISDKRSPEWLVSFIQSSQTLIKSGDSDANAIYKEYNNLLMPDQPVNASQANIILDYIKNAGSGEATSAVNVIDILENATVDNIIVGRLLFSGEQRLENGGASCISCHMVKDDNVFSYGTLAKDLTETYETMGSNGVSAILKSPPFPAMAVTYVNNPLTNAEILNLTAYLRSVSKERFYQHPADFGITFAVYGIFVFIMLLLSIIVLYFKRKKKSVNHEIFNRQSSVIN